MIRRLFRPIAAIFAEMNEVRRKLRRGGVGQPQALLRRYFVLNTAVIGLCVTAILLLVLITGIVRAVLGLR